MKQYVKAEEFRDTVCAECRFLPSSCADKQDLSNPTNVHWMYSCPRYFKVNLERYKEIMSHVAEDDE
jgi:hypothetical protein